MNFTRRYAFAFLLLSMPLAHGQLELTLEIDQEGQLTGARNVLVGESYYDMEFVRGSCIEVFDGCDESSDFPFQTYAGASEALAALEEQVLQDVPNIGNFDSDPTLSYSCEIDMPEPDTRCFIALPHDSNGETLPFIPVLINASSNHPEGDSVSVFLPVPTDFGTFQLENNTAFTWSNWTPSIIPDSDGDGVNDAEDNCLDINNADQRDTNTDGYGNQCDPDLNNDGVVNFADIGLFAQVFNTQNSGDADLDGDGAIGFLDFARMKDFFMLPPGPSAVSE